MTEAIEKGMRVMVDVPISMDSLHGPQGRLGVEAVLRTALRKMEAYAQPMNQEIDWGTVSMTGTPSEEFEFLVEFRVQALLRGSE